MIKSLFVNETVIVPSILTFEVSKFKQFENAELISCRLSKLETPEALLVNVNRLPAMVEYLARLTSTTR